jgi:hypothetical protein
MVQKHNFRKYQNILNLKKIAYFSGHFRGTSTHPTSSDQIPVLVEGGKNGWVHFIQEKKL